MSSFINFFGIIVVFSHIFACYWFALGTYHSEGTGYNGGDASWVAFNGYSDSSVGQQYMAALYYVLTTFSTVGYGDIAPVNELEQAFSCAAMTGARGTTLLRWQQWSGSEAKSSRPWASRCWLRQSGLRRAWTSRPRRSASSRLKRSVSGKW